jgi:kynurenine formamidase
MAEWYESGQKWYPSEYGESDELGSYNNVTPDKVLKAVSLVKKGRILDLSHEIYNGMPGRQSAHGPFFYLLSQRVYDNRPPFRAPTKNKFGASLCRMEMVDHLATHLDSLNHIAFENKFYNGIDAFDVSTTYGTTKLGIDTTPSLVTKGIAVDATGGRNIMGQGEPISLEFVKEYLKERHIEVENGDAIFFYTGVGQLWHDPPKYNDYFENSPGIGIDLAKWLASKKVSVTGSDAPATEVSPPELKNTRLPVHQYLITLHGIRLIDNINLNELVKEGVSQFMFTLSPLKILGATASPVSPMAIF